MKNTNKASSGKDVMINEDSKDLWFAKNNQFFLVPEQTEFTSGPDRIYDLQENEKQVTLADLAKFACSQEEAKAYLQAVWQASLEATKCAWLDLYTFAQHTGQEVDLGEVNKQFQEGLQMAGDPAQEIFEMSRAFVASISDAAQSDIALDDALPSADAQRALFKRVFSQLPTLVDQFSESNLEQAADDPEAWAQNLYQQVFGEVEDQKKAKHRQELANDIQASIAERLRAAGLTPSVDL